MFTKSLSFLPRFPRRHQSRSRPRPRARLLVESLEDRALLSVIVGQSGGTLNITDNDTSGHTHQCQPDRDPGNVYSAGGLRCGASTFAGIRNINANLGGDSDTLLFNSGGFSTTLAGNLSVTAADGNNSIDEGFSAIQGNVSVSEGNGTDSVDFGGGAVNGNVSVSQGNGNNDQVNFGVNFANLSNTSFSETTTIGGNLAVDSGQRQHQTR